MDQTIKARTGVYTGDEVYIITANEYMLEPTDPRGANALMRYTMTKYSYRREAVSDVLLYSEGTYDMTFATTPSLETADLFFRAEIGTAITGRAYHRREYNGGHILVDSDGDPEAFCREMQELRPGEQYLVCLTEDRAAHICRKWLEYEKDRMKRHSTISGVEFVWPWDDEMEAYAAADSSEYDGNFRKFRDIEEKELEVSVPVFIGDTVFHIKPTDTGYCLVEDSIERAGYETATGEMFFKTKNSFITFQGISDTPEEDGSECPQQLFTTKKAAEKTCENLSDKQESAAAHIEEE